MESIYKAHPILGGLGGDAGLLAAGAAAVFLLYTAITMMTRRKKRSNSYGEQATTAILDDQVWQGRKIFLFLWSIQVKL